MRRILILVSSNSEQKKNKAPAHCEEKLCELRIEEGNSEFILFLLAGENYELPKVQISSPIKRSLLLTYTLVQRDFQPALWRTKIQLICTLHKANKPA